MNSENLHKKTHKHILILIGIILISFITYNTRASVLPDMDQQKDKINKNLVYAITTPHHLAVIDTTTDKIIKTIDIGSKQYLNPLLSVDGKFFASYYKEFLGPVGDSIMMYDPKTGNKILKECESGPNGIVIIEVDGKKKVFVANYTSRKQEESSSISVFHGDALQPTDTIVFDKGYNLYYSITPSIDKTKLYVLASNISKYRPPNYDQLRLYVIDTRSEKILMTKDMENGGAIGRIFESLDGKIYYGPGFETYGEPLGKEHLSYNLIVLDNKDYHFLHKIELTQPAPVGLVYYPNLNKLYVQGFVDGLKDYRIDVIDTKTDKLIKTLTIEGSDGIYRVSKDKLYINMIYVEDDKRGFQVLDVNKDEITGFIPGKFGGVSTIPIEWMMGK